MMKVTIAEIMERLPAALVAERAQGVDAVIHFKFTGAQAGEWNAVIRDGTCSVAQGIPKSRPTITLAADSADFVSIAMGELDGVRATMDGRVRATGDLLLAPKLLELFRVA